MLTPIVTKKKPIHRVIWHALDDTAKLVLLANQKVQIDDDGLPCCADEVTGQLIVDIETALGLRAEPAAAGGAL